ncbi:hypothetical protein CU669_15340 [Paramagnetospirillum kuznetsovii]|uniref:histidine kinase n=1 Tax=Paramagnetospirillum kuznetsovii TaxID=2053833 RepID=A0A364NVN5_9PROT|nr:sensor histidine kinase [Paramagnetospirillum kuznetsovii]RAU20965.1 hypothetical protein CU669_15340 [Paramagnetospirillum kuznetsovii]
MYEPRSIDFGLNWWIWRARGTALLLVVAICCLWGWQAWQNRERELINAELLVASLARAADSQVDGAMRSVEFLLDEAADRIDMTRWPSTEHYEWFRARLTGLPEISALIVADADGNVAGATISREAPKPSARKSSIADREYFAEAKAQFPGRRFLVGKPTPSRFSDRLSIPLVRALVRPDGSFGGVIVAGLVPTALRDRIASVVIEEAGGAAVFRHDAVVLARVPGQDEFVGKAFPNTPIFQEDIPRRRVGVSRFIAPTDGNDKIIAYRSLERYPLVVTVGITKNTVLADWRRQMVFQAIALGVLSIALIAIALLYDRRTMAARELTEQLAQSHLTLERQVEDRTAHLAAANAELEHFAYAASHDLQEPLRNVTGFLQLLARRYGGKLDAEADEFIDFAVKAAKQMSLLITDVLTYSSTGRSEAAAEACEAAPIVKAAVGSLATAIAESGADIRIGALPSIACQPVLIQSLFQNLISNAIKYRDPARPPVVEIQAVASPISGMVEFTVTDNGIGVEDQYLERMFGLFQRLHPRSQFEGTGIGLALCRKIVDRHGGRIWAESKPGHGTVIHVTLPS